MTRTASPRRPLSACYLMVVKRWLNADGVTPLGRHRGSASVAARQRLAVRHADDHAPGRHAWRRAQLGRYW